MYEKGRKVKGVHKIMAQHVIKRDGSKEEIATSELREKILSDLDAIKSSVAQVWRQYDEARGRA